MSTERDDLIIGFLLAYYRSLNEQMRHINPDARLPNREAIGNAAAVYDWRNIVAYVQDEPEPIVDARDARIAELTHIVTEQLCERWGRELFAPYRCECYTPPPWWAEHELGKLWHAARNRAVEAQGDRLLTIVEAATHCGVSRQVVQHAINAGRLRPYTNPQASQRQGRRLVRLSEAEQVLGKKENQS